MSTAHLPLPNPAHPCYHPPLNAKLPSRNAKLWHQPPAGVDQPAEGYDDWLKAELAKGLADAQVGRLTPLEKVRKEFGLE